MNNSYTAISFSVARVFRRTETVRWFACVLLGVLSGTARVWAASEGRVAGITEPLLDVTVSVPVAGTVTARCFAEGDFVKKGQVILELDKRIEELAMTRRQLVVETLKTDLEGTRHLFSTTKSVSKDDLDKKELEYRVAEVDYQTAVEQLRRRQIVAPIDGFIAEILPEVGEDCRAQDPVVRIVDTRQCYFVANVDAKAGHGLGKDQKMALSIEAGASPTAVEGVVTFVSPIVDPASGLMKVKILFLNREGNIRPGVAGELQLKPAGP